MFGLDFHHRHRCNLDKQRTLVEIGPAIAEPMTAAEVRAWLGLTASAADEVLAFRIAVARAALAGKDGWLGRALITQTFELRLCAFPPGGDPIVLPLPPLQSISSVKFFDRSGVDRTLDPQSWRIVSGEPAAVAPPFHGRWPDARQDEDCVRIRFVAGYGDQGSAVPAPIRQSMALAIAKMQFMMSPDITLKQKTVFGVGRRDYETQYDFGAVYDATAEAMLSQFRVML